MQFMTPLRWCTLVQWDFSVGGATQHNNQPNVEAMAGWDDSWNMEDINFIT